LKTVQIKVLTSFNGLQAGSTGIVDDTALLRAYERAGLVEVNDGPDQDRQGRPAKGDPGREHERAADRGTAGGEPGEGFGSGGYGETPREHRATGVQPDMDPAPAGDSGG
jgi:hypothetical protein